MRKVVILAALLCAGGVFSVSAQDMIVLRNGNVVEGKVTEITATDVRFKRFDNLNGPTIVIAKFEVLSIKYENGTLETINVSSTGATVDYQNFSPIQRFGTWGLNFVVPGLGSYVIMHDKRGGTTLLITGVVSYGLIISGTIVAATSSRSSRSSSGIYRSSRRTGQLVAGIIMLGCGGGLYVFETVYNIVRSITYRRPVLAGTIVDPSAWDIALVPGENGIEHVSLAYTMRF